jgi:FkbM family methyltransferase
VIAPQPMSYDRATGRLDGATAMERCAALVFAAGARASAPMHYRGFSVGCRAVMSMLDQREIVVLLNDDARFAFPFGDGYWSLLLDRGFVYEGDIERFLRSVADVDYCFVDGGANFGFWSVLVSSRPFGGHPAVAIEASSANAARLRRNAEINQGRFKVLHRAIGAATGAKVWLSGAKHEAFRVGEANGKGTEAGESVDMIALDSLLDQGLVSAGQRLVVKLDVEGMEIEAAKGGRRLLENETVIIVEDHGSDRAHTVSRYLLSDPRCRLFVFDPATRRYEPMTEVSTLDRIKTSTVFGYNIFATNSPQWEERIRSIPPSTHH